MPAVAIKTPFGADVLRTFAVYGMECDPEKDVALFVIRDKNETVHFWCTIKPEHSEDLQTWVFNLHITHEQAERIAKGSYKYGLTFYKDVEYDNSGEIPQDGSVVAPIARQAYIVQEAVAREEGLI